MATLIRKNRPKSSTSFLDRKPAAPATLPIPSHSEPEAPDRGDRSFEREAPDAGEGRAGTLEGEFTHGRSQG